MKTNCWLVIGTMLAATAVAQVNTSTLPEIPAPATAAAPAPAPASAENTNALAPAGKKPAPVKHKKRVVKRVAKKINEPAVTLVPGPATVASKNLNVRGQAGLKGEVIAHLKLGDTVTVITQINLDKHAADEPAQWAKISLPSGAKVWVSTHFVDATTKTVTAKKLNLRAGPGENYSVLGVIEKGTPVSEIATKGGWTQIEPPANAFAFVAAMFLNQSAMPIAEATTPAAAETPEATMPPPTTSTVAEAPPIVTQPSTPAPAPATAPATVPATAPAIAETTPSSVVDTNPPPPRVVTHEGYVRSFVSPVAPTSYELYDMASGNAIDYLYTTSTNLNLEHYVGYRIIVTGPEGISARWDATPVLTVQKIYVVSTLPIPVKRVYSPRAISNQRR
jgi:uncharacterized protein YgiM (DUF1202 family)